VWSNVIDRKTGELTKWGLNGVEANYPMALNEDNHRLFVVTRRPPFLMCLIPIPVRKLGESRWGDLRRCLLRRGAQAHLCPRRRRIYQRDPTE